VSVATTLARSKGGQFIAHVKTLPGNPHGGQLEAVIPEIETQIGASLSRIVADRGYRGHNARPDHKNEGLRLRPEARPHRGDQTRPAPSLGGQARHRPRQGEHYMGRNFLKGAQGDTANTVLAAAGYNLYGTRSVKLVLLLRSSNWK
jgi:IS5 family transposase